MEIGADYISGCGEMVYTLDSGSSGGNPVEVQVLSSAPTKMTAQGGHFSWFE